MCVWVLVMCVYVCMGVGDVCVCMCVWVLVMCVYVCMGVCLRWFVSCV